MTNDDNYWSKLKEDILKAENLNQVQVENLKSVLSHLNELDDRHVAYFFNLSAIYTLKIINEYKKYSNDQIIDAKQKCELFLEYYIKILQLESFSLKKNEIICLINGLINPSFSLKSLETFNCTFDKFKEALKNVELPSLNIKTSKNDDFICKMNSQLNERLAKPEATTKETLIQLNLKHMIKTRKLNLFIDYYLKTYLVKLSEYRKNKQLEYGDLRKNLMNINQELTFFEELLSPYIINGLLDDSLTIMVDFFVVLFQISVILSSNESDTSESNFVSVLIKLFNGFNNELKLNNKLPEFILTNINAKCAYFLSLSLQKVLIHTNRDYAEHQAIAASPKLKEKIKFGINFNCDLAKLCVKLVEMIKFTFLGDNFILITENLPIIELDIGKKYSLHQLISFYTSSNAKILKLLPIILELSFKKCQSIYIAHKKAEDEASNKLSEKNIEQHNKEFSQQESLKDTEKLTDENFSSINNDNIKDIDAEDTSEDEDDDEDDDDDSEFLLLAPWFNEEQTNTSQADDNQSQASSNLTQVLDVTFELDSNQTYTRNIDLMIEIFIFYEILIVDINDDELTKLIASTLNDKEIKEFSFIINEIEHKTERLPERFVTAFMKFLQVILLKNILDINKQNALIANLGLKFNEWPLQINKYTINILIQLIIYRLGHKDDQIINDIASIWNGFLITLKKSILKRQNEFITKDVNIEHINFLLFIYYQLPLEMKQKILNQIAEEIVVVASEIRDMHKYPPLLLSRLIILFDYLMHYFDVSSNDLFNKVKECLELNANNLISSKKPLITSQFNDESFSALFENSNNFIESLENFYEYYNVETTFKDESHIQPRFYQLTKDKKDKLDEKAVTLLESNEKLYNDLYQSLIHMLKVGDQITCSKDNFAIEDHISISYVFKMIWKLLEKFPVDKQLQATHENHLNAHCLRLVNENKLKTASIILNADNLKSSIEYFTSFWLKKLENNSNELNALFEKPEIEIKISDNSIFEKFVDNLSLFNYHLNLLRNLIQNSKSKQNVDDETIKNLLSLLKKYTLIAKYYLKRCLLLEKFNSISKDKLSSQYLDTFSYILSIVSNNNDALLTSLNNLFPKNFQIFIKKYFETTLKSYSNSNDDNLDEILWSNLKYYWKNEEFCIKNALISIVQFIDKFNKTYPTSNDTDQLIINLNSDYICNNFLSSICNNYLTTNSILKYETYAFAHKTIFNLLTYYQNENQYLTNDVQTELLNYIELNLNENADAFKGFMQVYGDKNENCLTSLLMTTSKPLISSTYFTKMIIILNKIFKQSEVDGKFSNVLIQLNKIADFDAEFIQKWLSKLVMPPSSPTLLTPTPSDDSQQCKQALKQLTLYLVYDKNISEVVTLSILSALIQIASKLINTNYGIGFPDLIILMDTLSNAGGGLGHLYVFQACCIWLEYYCSLHLDKFKQTNEQNNYHIESACHLLAYVANILNTYRAKPDFLDLIKPNEQFPETLFDYDFYHNSFYTPVVMNKNQDESKASYQQQDKLNKVQQKIKSNDSDDSEEDDTELNAKLCTYTVTKKEFMNQHWYYCHTCKMVDRIGCCSICARVCHKGHDLSYAKFGSFFCDCGAKEDQSCKALIKRELKRKSSPSAKESDIQSTSDIVEVSIDQSKIDALKENKTKQLEKLKSQIFECVISKELLKSIKNLVDVLVPMAETSYKKTLLYTNTKQARDELTRMIHTNEKTIEYADQLFIATLGSQEGAFENVRMNFSSEQGQQIKTLLNSHSLRRVSMCCLTSKTKKHLIVTHEKGKSSHFTVLELNALLNQDSNKRNKLTLTKLSTVQVPFTLISVSANQSNDDYIALNGLKDCHVMYLNESGRSNQEGSANNTVLVLHPSLEGSNYILKSIWLPNSQTELAIITCDFIKIFDLSIDTISPSYYFLLPSGKIKDVTFYTKKNGNQFILIMSSNGYVYYEEMNSTTSAKNGMYYLTNTIEFSHSEINSTDGTTQGNGGISIYYSYQLKLLFWSYQNGKSFIASFKNDSFVFDCVTHLKLTKGESPNKNLQALCQWSEIQSHPGLILAMTHLSNNPIAIMLMPNKIYYQEIRLPASKSKIQDMVATRHPVGEPNEGEKTTMIILCDDGSLKIYVASNDKTDYWLKPHLKPLNPLVDLRNLVLAKRSQSKPIIELTKDDNSNVQEHKSKPMKFPIDYFEKSVIINDVEFGGNDLLEIYNVQQLKTRLANSRKVVCNKQNGFTIDIINKEQNMVITGCRVLVGLSSIDKAPSYFECLSGAVKVSVSSLTTSRWYDICLTRDQSYSLDNKLSLLIGPSTDSAHITMIDSIRVYGRTKEQFGWKEEECQAAKKRAKEPVPSVKAPVITSNAEKSNNIETNKKQSINCLITPPQKNSHFDKLLSHSLDILEDCLIYTDSNENDRKTAFNTSIKLLSLMTPAVVSIKAKSLLYSMSPNRDKVFSQIDETKLNFIVAALNSDFSLFDFESFQKVILICRSILFERSLFMVKFLNDSFKSSTHFIAKLNDLFWLLFNQLDHHSSIGHPLINDGIEIIIESLIEIMHAYSLIDSECVSLVADYYIQLLVCNETDITFTAKRVLLQLLKPRKKQPTKPTQTAIQSELVPVDQEIALPLVNEFLTMPLFEGGEEVGDIDEEEMMQLAMVLSMNDIQTNAQTQQAGALPPSIATAPGEVKSRKTKYTQGQESSNDMSISEDEDLNASIQQNNSDQESPIEEGDIKKPKKSKQAPKIPTETKKSTDLDDFDFNLKLFAIRKIILARFSLKIKPETFKSLQNGIKSIPFFQCILTLVSDLTPQSEHDKVLLDKTVKNMLALIEPIKQDLDSIIKRSPDNETKLIIIRTLSVLLSKSKYQKDGVNFIIQRVLDELNSFKIIDMCLQLVKILHEIWKETSVDADQSQQTIGTQLNKACYIKNGLLVKVEQDLKYLDEMSPFFVRDTTQKGPTSEIFYSYTQWLSETIIRLPYQMRKLSELKPYINLNSWCFFICEYLMLPQCYFLKRLMKKLLQLLCGSKEKYRKFKDNHILIINFKVISNICPLISSPIRTNNHHLKTLDEINPKIFSYNNLLAIVEYLKLINEIALTRNQNWQQFCVDNPNTILFLIEISLIIDESVVQFILQLILCALGGSKSASKLQTPKQQQQQTATSQKTNSKSSKSQILSGGEENLNPVLIGLFFKNTSKHLMSKFFRMFLLESNQDNLRWIVHSLIYSIYKHSTIQNQDTLYELMIELWSDIDKYGIKASQFVDLIGYIIIKSQSNSNRMTKFIDLTVELFKKQNKTLATHPNSTIYNLLAGCIEFDGFYLESDPCFICNNPEIPLQTYKLGSIKVDSRFTTNTQIVKLVSSHSISKIQVKISDIRKSKMVNTLNIYYNNKSVKSVVDLKNKSNVWLKAKKVTLQPAQTEVKIDFVLPIVACNLMIEYADFYENISVTSETQLQCPRCSATVPAHPGVCGNCGENVFQCHKCRSINYDERDPFLCNACGFCKFAKFEYSLVARPCCDVDPIENEDDRKKTMQTISSLLDKADKSYKTLSGTTRPTLEGLIIKMNEQYLNTSSEPNNDSQKTIAPPNTTQSTTSTTTAPPPQPAPNAAIKIPLATQYGSNLPHVNKTIQQIASKYNTECKSTFEELSRITQKLSLCRKELKEYDRQFRQSSQVMSNNVRPNSNCYGCAFACVEHCVTLLRAILVACGTEKLKNELCSKDLIEELVNFNLKRPFLTIHSNGTTRNYGRDVVNLIYLLIKDNSNGSDIFNQLLLDKIELFLRPVPQSSSSLMSSFAISNPNCLRHEMLLLSALIQKQDDSCWESRLRLIIQILLRTLTSLNSSNNPCAMDSIVLPCLKMLNYVCKLALNNTTIANKQGILKKTVFKTQISEPAQLQSDQVVTYNPQILSEINPIEFLTEKESYYMKWVKFNFTNDTKPSDDKALVKKCFNHWNEKLKELKKQDLNEYQYNLKSKWLRNCIFCPSSKAIRQITCNILQNIFSFWTQTQDDTYCYKKFAIAKLMSSFLPEICTTGENFSEFLLLYKSIIADRECKFRLVLKEHVLTQIEEYLTNEIKILSDLERGELSATNLTLGYSVKSLAELISQFLKETTIKNKFKTRLVATILNSYLSLKKLIFQRTKLIEEAQENLLESLEEMTSGTQSETHKFMSICIDTVNKFDSDDLVTPVYLFERVCNIIYPEDSNDNKEFFLILEKDPNQEDYLQGRMLGNPYSSNDPSMGPLMRNIKNKICTDCELIALLDDDNGMELLVNNKIISLDLQVRDVFKKLWVAEGASEIEPMKIIYRMTGLSGDATEDIIDNLDAKSKDQTKSDEEIYKMADELAKNGALKVMLDRLNTINVTNFTLGKPLLSVLVKLFGYALKLNVNRQEIIKSDMDAIKTMLNTLNMIFKIETTEPNKVGVQLAEQLLALLECILSEASKLPNLISSGADTEQLQFLLDNIKCSFVRTNSNLLEALMRIIPFLSFGDESKMKALIEYFKPYYSNFDKYDNGGQSNEDTIHLECFCVIINGIEISENGTRLRDLMCDSGVLRESVDYLLKNSPKITTYLNSDFDKWKDFLSKSSLPFVLRILTGLSRSHERIQEIIGESLVPLLHKLEQFSTGSSSIGVLGEDLLLQLKLNQKVAKTIEEVQTQTKNEKKKLAMAMRSKQLSQLGMKTNEKGQLLADPRAVKISESEIEEEKGHTCRICREGYKYHPQKVLAIYTFTKKVEIEAYENKPRKSVGYSTVTHFNIVHIDCHSNAIRVARNNRDEWENATLLNANTKCNGLLPLWGPDVPETVFSTALARHNSYLSETTGIRDTTYSLSIHDLKLLLLRFSENRSFSEDTGGGGRESNICLVPYMIHMILYSVNVAKYVAREERNLTNFLDSNEKLILNSFELDNVFYYLTIALIVMKPASWTSSRVNFLERAILTSHCRSVITGTDKSKLNNINLQDFKIYKPTILFFGIINLFFSKIHAKVTQKNQSWTESLATYIRANDIQIMESCNEILNEFEDELMKCEDWSEIMDVLGLLSDIPDPLEHFKKYIASFK